MKRTKNMILATLVATMVIAISLMSTAFAAPATCPFSGSAAGTTAKTCPASNLLSQYLGSGVNPACPNGNCNTGNCLTGNCYKNNCTTGTCPTSNLLQQLLGNYGSTLPTGCTNGNCPTGNCINGNCINGNCVSGNCTTGNCINGNCLSGNCANGACKTLTCLR